MSRYRIVCTEQTNCTSSGHITAVGVGNDPNQASTRLTVREVWDAMDRGDQFFTSDGYIEALVEKYRCGCSLGSLRTVPDASRRNNLDSLRICHFA